MTSEKGSRRDKNQNIQVFVRLRPLNQRERDIKSLGVVEVVNGREVVVRQSQQTSLTKKFTFDRAFGPHTKQIEVYQQVVSPLIKEVLCGYNCTVFAYGQTGTGKTHTMVGESTGDENVNWQNDPLAGIIPRALSQLFDELRISNTEYTVRVSYLELYNEELFDLLSSSEDNSKLRIYEDVTRKGANIVNGLEEITVYNKNEVYKIMEQGQERKRVASTLMNAQSSRSHTVFTIVAHMKENNQEGEELVKIGKLNLVDLAGSENISKAGSDNPAKKERARECVNINQSLLTLGRVITALVERHPHIPYRESKLTRILQESLGGRTKTSIIATVSPGHKDLEETMSTLEYAHRAKNIQNKPEVNQKMTKTAMLKEYAEEIDKLKRDLQAARDKNGVCISSETFAEMNLKEEEQRKEIQELLLKKRAMEEERDRMETVFKELNQTLEERVSELNNTRQAMQTTKAQLVNTKNALQTTKIQCEEQKHLVGKHRATEEELSAQAKDIIAVADTAANHVHNLHASVDKRRMVESRNIQVTQSYREQAAALRAGVAGGTQSFIDALAHALQALHQQTDNYTTSSTSSMEQDKKKLEELAQKILDTTNETSSTTGNQYETFVNVLSLARSELTAGPTGLYAGIRAALLGCLQRAAAGKLRVSEWEAPQAIEKLVQGWLNDATERVAFLRRSHENYHKSTTDAESKRVELHKRQRDARRQRVLKASGRIDVALTQLQTEKTQLENRLTKQLSDIEQERRESEARLERWAEEERLRLARHVEAERLALYARLEKRIADVEEEKKTLEERVKNIESWRAEQMAAVEEENKMADADLADCEAGGTDGRKCLDKFGKQLVEGTIAMNADFRAFSGNIVQVTEHYNKELLDLLTRATEQIEQEANSAIALAEQDTQQLCVRTNDTLDSVLTGNKQLLDALVQKIEASAAATVSSLATVSSSTSGLIQHSRAALEAHSTSVQEMLQRTNVFHDNLRQALTQQEQLEGRAFGEEFKLYSPTGKTPVRQEYRFPRTLAATSPHERILARFRAMRQNGHDEDCIVVESDAETRPPSDSESSVSEDSALSEFTTPSPPAEPRAQPIIKCTSETDIYYRKPGKENSSIPPYKPVSHKKTSRLPAPTSHKKPLIERND
ncbi:kinesin-like protein Klp61F isoform X2 [Leguminivora glycinivorella]|uniref:kinesin-like protein Klp61F isoform X2 n=1 Tax=Leguminivora glycinivorella TaxID=1035111 RepID=UPI00200EB8C5|nr:kinesin-like protein Klp61F isoform X2 [Leguminivora glycinivorella]